MPWCEHDQNRRPPSPAEHSRRLARTLPIRSAIALILAVAGIGVFASVGSAVVVHLANGKTLSYVSLRGQSTARPLDEFFSNLDYDGGPVMPSNTNYAVYWRPSTGPDYPAEYQSGVNQYLEDLAHDSGGHENVDSVSAQYNDAAGAFSSYVSHFGGPLIDTDPYPANGCKRAPICLTDTQLQKELTEFVKAHGLAADLTHEYFLLTPPTVEDCFEASGNECSVGSTRPTYCAYHGNIPLEGGGEIVYSNDPYVTGDFGCDDGEHPNGKPSDGVLEGGLTHEHDESLTDPEPNNAWTDYETGYEIGDKCRTFVAASEFGTPLGKASNGAKYNQVINGHDYWYQQEWSNQGHKCLQRLTFSGAEPVATFTAAAGSGNRLAFDATDSTAPGGVARYSWQFNDGSFPEETTTPTTSHLFSSAGQYRVALTVFAADGTSLGTARSVTAGDESPTAAFSITSATPTVGQPVAFDASASKDPDGRISNYAWSFGDGSPSGTGATPSHTYATSGTYTVTLTVTDSAGLVASVSHSVVVGKASQVIVFTSTPPSGAVVGGSPYTVTATGGGSGNPVTFAVDPAASSVCALSGASVSFVGAGLCTIDANQAGNGSHTPAPQMQQSFTVNAASSSSSGSSSSVTSSPRTMIPLVSTLPSIALEAPTSSAFVARSKKINTSTGAISFEFSVADPGSFSWRLTFANGRFGVFTASNARCARGLIRLKGKCRPSTIVLAHGSKLVLAPGKVSLTVKPSASASRALRDALRQNKGLPVSATFTFQSSRGGAPVSHAQTLIVKLKKK
jgi:PKD repeat protein